MQNELAILSSRCLSSLGHTLSVSNFLFPGLHFSSIIRYIGEAYSWHAFVAVSGGKEPQIHKKFCWKAADGDCFVVWGTIALSSFHADIHHCSLRPWTYVLISKSSSTEIYTSFPLPSRGLALLSHFIPFS